jgi:lysophospholipase L1-like esterase
MKRVNVMPFPVLGRTLIAVLLSVVLYSPRAQAAKPAPVEYLFTDEPLRLDWNAPAGTQVTYRIRRLTPTGWQEPLTRTAAVEQNHLAIAAAGEGIQVVTFADGREVRFFAFDPPAAAPDPAQLKKSLPRAADKLLSGQPITLVAMGDSVTATGAYPLMLGKMLARATGNPHITVEVRAHAGRSIDATVRAFEEEVAPLKPDVGLLMYGLNDQAASTGLDVFLEQTRWIYQRLAEMGCDLVLLQPTPHIDAKAMATEPGYPIRTIGYGEALRSLARELHVPLAETFNAIWCPRYRAIPDAVHAMWPLFPRHYSKPLTSMLESDGAGDSIHTNALGHLQMARAVYAALTMPPAAAPLNLTAQTRWNGHEMLSVVRASNEGTGPWSGTIDLYPPTDAKLQGALQTTLDLPAGAAREIQVRWPELTRPDDLFNPPYNSLFILQSPCIHALLTRNGITRVTAVYAPMAGGSHFKKGRWHVPATASSVAIDVLGPQGQRRDRVEVPLPKNDDIGHAMLAVPTDGDLPAAEVYLVRDAGATVGEPKVDGRLDEWAQASWRRVHFPPQRSRVPATMPAGLELRFAIQSGRQGMSVALKSPRPLQGDTISFFFDIRSPGQLGTVGPYTWLDATLEPNGQVKLRPGETAPRALDRSLLVGAWTREGEQTTVELSFPYAVLGATAWPASGELGFNVVWVHRLGDDKKTGVRQLWSDNRHWWTPVGFGVVHLQQKPDEAELPWLVRVR